MNTVHLVDWTDLTTLYEYLLSSQMRALLWRKLAARMRQPRGDIFRVSRCLEKQLPWNWWEIPWLSGEIQSEVSGRKQVSPKEYLADKYLGSRHPQRAVSLMCGSGYGEREWLKHINIADFEGYDISRDAIECARKTAREKGLDCLRYQVADANQLSLSREAYDVAFCEFGLHHLRNLEKVLLEIKACLKKNGHLVVSEFVGPNRFQWSAKHTKYCDALLNLLPPDKRRYSFNVNRVKKHCLRHSRLRMYLMDPSESLNSESIVPLIRKHFRVKELRYMSGGIANRVFDAIAHNFMGNDPRTVSYLSMALEVERALTKSGEVEPHFVCVVASVSE